jgi:hypothetical protein
MDKSDLVIEYENTKKHLEVLILKVGIQFVYLAKKAIKNDDLDTAIDVMESCPDELTKQLIADLINESPSKHGFYG